MALEAYPVASFHKDKIELTKKWSYDFSPGTRTNWAEEPGERLIKFNCRCQNYNFFSVSNSFLWCSVCTLLEVGLSVGLIPLSFEDSALVATSLIPHCFVHFEREVRHDLNQCHLSVVLSLYAPLYPLCWGVWDGLCTRQWIMTPIAPSLLFYFFFFSSKYMGV